MSYRIDLDAGVVEIQTQAKGGVSSFPISEMVAVVACFGDSFPVLAIALDELKERGLAPM